MKPTASLLTLAPVALALAIARPASAQSIYATDAVGSSHPSSDALAATLRNGVERERLVRTSLGLSGIALGAGFTGAGAMLALDSHGQPTLGTAGWTGIGVGGLLLTTSIVSLLMPGPMETLDRTLADARRAGLGEREAIEATERRWVTLADRAHTARVIEGGVMITGALAMGATGAAVALAPQGGNASVADERGRVALGALLGAGAASFATAGIAMIARESDVESSLRTWRATQAPARRSDVGLGSPTVSVADGGVVVGVGGTF